MIYDIEEIEGETHSRAHIQRLNQQMESVNINAVISLIRDALNEEQMRSLNVTAQIKNESPYYSSVKKIVISISPDQVLDDGTAMVRDSEYHEWCSEISTGAMPLFLVYHVFFIKVEIPSLRVLSELKLDEAE